MPPLPIDWSTGARFALKGLGWIWGRLSMCSVSIGGEWIDSTFEEGVKWIHVPVTVKPGLFGSNPIVDATVDITESTLGPIPLLWQNRNDESDKPERKMTLAPGSYFIPLAARTSKESFALSGRAVTAIPINLHQGWLLKRGIVRITNGTHYFTFVNYPELSKRDLYKFTIAIKNQLGKVVAEKEVTLAVPEANADNKYFYLT